MIGIDYEKASLDIRGVFSFHKHSTTEALDWVLSNYPDVSGAVLISTCNRTELYISSVEGIDNILEILCGMKEEPIEKFKDFVTERKGKEAVSHLLHVACGIKSKVFGEDQILAQVKVALAWAREAQTADSFLEKLFQTAIAAAKKVKTETHLTAVKTSVIEEMIEALYKETGSLAGKKCMVIGNGEIGKLAASRMVQEGADVTVTIRNYKTRNVEVPKGCRSIEYADRLGYLGECDIVISGTSSPHYTLDTVECPKLLKKNGKVILVDLAVPRDIPGKLGELENVIVYDIDSLGGAAKTEKDNDAMAKAMDIIREHQEELGAWETAREYVSTVKKISGIGGLDAYKRTEKKVKNIIEDEDKCVEIEKLFRSAAQKTISAMLFDLKKNLTTEQWQICVNAFEKNMLQE